MNFIAFLVIFYFSIIFQEKHEISAVNLASTMHPTSQHPKGRKVQGMGGGGGRREERKDPNHARSDQLINLTIMKIILILRQYKQNTIMLLT